MDESPKPSLISKTHSSWNLGPEFNQKAQLSTNLILKDEIVKKQINKKNLQN